MRSNRLLLPFLALVMAGGVSHAGTGDTRDSDARFDALMDAQSRVQEALKVDAVLPWTHSADNPAATIEVPADVFSSWWTAAKKNAEGRSTKRLGPAVVLGATRYQGEERNGVLHLTLSLSATLHREDAWKSVPLVGSGAIVVNAKVDGEPIATSLQHGYQVWHTRRTGEVSVEVELLVPPRGPRGSIEYDFVVARTPVTEFDCLFSVAKLEPRIDNPVSSKVTSDDGKTRLVATLRPATRLHLVGFRDLGAGPDAVARTYAESLNLLSVDDGSLDVFAALRYTILYAGQKRFDVVIPEGLTVVSADGEGAFQYTLEPLPEGQGAGQLLRGQTAVPIRDRYEISLRLKRRTADGGDRFAVPIPTPQGVERHVGWIAVEVPGKLRLDEASRRGEVREVDTRQLPRELVRSAVSPILRAYRFHGANRGLSLSATRLPEHDIVADSIDRVRATTVTSATGTVLTELRVTMRNRLRHSLALDLPEGATVKSALLDGLPVNPSRDASGRLRLPLKRSAGSIGALAPLTLSVVFANEVQAPGLIGETDLALPAFELPVMSLQWTVYAPNSHDYQPLEADVPSQGYTGRLSWYRAAGARTSADAAPRRDRTPRVTPSAVTSADGGMMPVRITLPTGGKRLDYSRYWIPADTSVRTTLPYAAGWVRTALLLLATLLVMLACGFAVHRNGATRAIALTVAAATGLGYGVMSDGGGVALLAFGGVVGLLVGALLRQDVRDTSRAFGAWCAGLPGHWATQVRTPDVVPTAEGDIPPPADDDSPRQPMGALQLAVVIGFTIAVAVAGFQGLRLMKHLLSAL